MKVRANCIQGIFAESETGKDYFGDPGVDREVLLDWTLRALRGCCLN